MTNQSNSDPCPEIGINVGMNASMRSIWLEGNGGTAPYQYSLNGTTYQSSDEFSNLAPQEYQLWARDANGCIGNNTVTLPAPEPNTCPVLGLHTGVNGNAGTIDAAAFNGTAPYRYSLDNVTYNTSGSFSGLQPGTYTIWVLDTNNCPCTRNIELPPPS